MGATGLSKALDSQTQHARDQPSQHQNSTQQQPAYRSPLCCFAMDWRALLSKPPSKVVSRSPFSATKHEQSLSGAGAADQTHSTAAQQTDAGPARQQAEYVVPILLSKQAVVQITPAEK